MYYTATWTGAGGVNNGVLAVKRGKPQSGLELTADQAAALTAFYRPNLELTPELNGGLTISTPAAPVIVTKDVEPVPATPAPAPAEPQLAPAAPSAPAPLSSPLDEPAQRVAAAQEAEHLGAPVATEAAESGVPLAAIVAE